MFSFLAELFGKHRDVRELERLLHHCGLDPRAVTDAMKFAVCKWVREAVVPENALPASGAQMGWREDLRASAADLLAFCILGSEDFSEANTVMLAERQAARIEAAVKGQCDFDANIVMLTLQAGNAHPEIVESVEMESPSS
jgi:hypothetical protein